MTQSPLLTSLPFFHLCSYAKDNHIPPLKFAGSSPTCIPHHFQSLSFLVHRSSSLALRCLVPLFLKSACAEIQLDWFSLILALSLIFGIRQNRMLLLVLVFSLRGTTQFQLWFVMFAHFLGVNTRSMVDFTKCGVGKRCAWQPLGVHMSWFQHSPGTPGRCPKPTPHPVHYSAMSDKKRWVLLLLSRLPLPSQPRGCKMMLADEYQEYFSQWTSPRASECQVQRMNPRHHLGTRGRTTGGRTLMLLRWCSIHEFLS